MLHNSHRLRANGFYKKFKAQLLVKYSCLLQVGHSNAYVINSRYLIHNSYP